MRIATRGSALALAQSQWVADRMPGHVELVPLVTTGDRHRNPTTGPAREGAPLTGPRAGGARDKAEWVIELEDALLSEEVDLAVHSAKDVPVALAPGLELIATPPRADPRDVLCGAASVDDVRVVGTSSLRRAAQLRARWPHVEVVELRGNVDTRLRKLAAGAADAIVLAAAGLQRLGRLDEADATLDLVPAAGQGTLVLEARAHDASVRAAVQAIHDEATWRTLRAERALVAALDADCRTPVGAHCVGDTMRAFVGAVDGSSWVVDELTLGGDAEPEELGASVAQRLLAAGAGAVLRG